MSSVNKPGSWINPWKYNPRTQNTTERELGLWMNRTPEKFVPIDSSWSWLGPGENVRSHGAKGDGSTDDLTAIQAALDAATATNGGATVWFPPGTYFINGNLNVSSNTRILGSGNSTIQQTLNSTGGSHVIFEIGAGVTNVWVEAMRFDGQRASATAASNNSSIITIRGASFVMIRDNYFFDSQNNGVIVLDDANLVQAEDITIIGNHAQHCGGDADPGAGQDLWGAFSAQGCKRVTFIGNTIEGSSARPGSYAFIVEINNENENVEGLIISGNTSKDSGDILLNGASATGINIDDVVITGNTTTGLNQGGGGVKFLQAKNVVYANNVSRSAKTNQAVIVDQSESVHIHNNIIQDYGSSADPYGIEIRLNNTDIVIGDNIYEPNAGATTPSGIEETDTGNTVHVTGQQTAVSGISTGDLINLTSSTNTIVHQFWDDTGRILADTFQFANAAGGSGNFDISWVGAAATLRGSGGTLGVEMDTLIGSLTTTTMSGNETFTATDGVYFERDPNNSDRTFNPSGAFTAGTTVVFRNKGNPSSGNIQFDSTALNKIVMPGQEEMFFYQGAAWRQINAGEVKKAAATITTGEVLALFGTPITVVPAPGSNRVLEFIGAVLNLDYNSVAYAGVAGGEDLVFKYTDASGAECSGQLETTGFIDQTSDQTRLVKGIAVTPVVNSPIVLHLLVGEIITGNSPVKLTVDYIVHETALG